MPALRSRAVGLQQLVVLASAAVLALAVNVRAELCPLLQSNVTCHKTTLTFIVDTSISTDAVAVSMRAALQLIGGVNGAVLSFSDYMLATWNFAPDDVKHYSTIQHLTAAFEEPDHLPGGAKNPNAVIGNIRKDNPADAANNRNDWAYMLDSLDVAVRMADDGGLIVIMGDENELCDGRERQPNMEWGFPNAAGRNLLLPSIRATAERKHLRILFYYFIKDFVTDFPYNTRDPNGCDESSTNGADRQQPMNTVRELAQHTGGVAVFSNNLAAQMAHEVKLAGKQAAVCPTCQDSPSLGVIVDTSESAHAVTARMQYVLTRLLPVAPPRELRPFSRYLVNTFASAADTMAEYATLEALLADMQDSSSGRYANWRGPNDSSARKNDDWYYMITSLASMVHRMAGGGYVIVFTDEEAMCDAYTGSPLLYSDLLSDVIAEAIAKQISVSFYAFQNPDGLLCTLSQRTAARDKMDATAVILNGEFAMDHAGLDVQMQAELVRQNNLRVCTCPPQECARNASLAIVMDTSASVVDDLKHELRTLFTQLAALPAASLNAFTDGFLLNTWAFPSDLLFHFDTAAQMNTFTHSLVPVYTDVMWANRATLQPLHAHDDWQYMSETLKLTVERAGKDSFVVVIADDNQICDGGFFYAHTITELQPTIALAISKNIKISYFAFATPNHWCTHAQMANGRAMATQLSTQTGGAAFFEDDPADWAADLANKVVPAIVAQGSRPVCESRCPDGYYWLPGHGCVLRNPCDAHPCLNGGTCVHVFGPLYECRCVKPFFWGRHCEHHCVPWSTPGSPRHGLGVVLDTSDSAAYLSDSMVQAVDRMVAAHGSFDKYLLSTWGYTGAAADKVKLFSGAAALKTELQSEHARKSLRWKEDVGLAQHNDWKYMLDSVDEMLQRIGSDGVLVVLADHEQVCDADAAARTVNGELRYPTNPDLTRINQLNLLAVQRNIQIFFFTFPSSDNGWCDWVQKQTGLSAARALVQNTNGRVQDVAGYMSDDTLQQVREALLTEVEADSLAERCDCAPGSHLNVDLHQCQ